MSKKLLMNNSNTTKLTQLDDSLAVINLARLGVVITPPGAVNFRPHTATTHGDYYGFEWVGFYRDYFEFDTPNADTRKMIGLSLPYATDTEKLTCNYECVSGAFTDTNYLGVKIKNYSIQNYLAHNELYIAVTPKPRMRSYVIKPSEILKTNWTEDRGYVAYEYIDNSITDISSASGVYATNSPLYNNKPVVIGKLSQWNNNVYVRVEILEEFATSLDDVKQLLTDNKITIRY